MKTITLTQGLSVAVDDEDYESLNNYKWCAARIKNKIYAVRWDGSLDRNISMHQSILPGHAMIDHINGDGLDNRRSNLRPCTNRQNQMNRKCKGYYLEKDRNKYKVSISTTEGQITVGRVDTEEEAIALRAKVEEEVYGDYRFDR